MAIGVFDFGIGGLSVHRTLVDRLGTADFVFLGDQANMPYGGRSGEEIVALTRAGCEILFGHGCDLVILACNTAASIALRRLQQSWIPDYRAKIGRPVNVLGLIVPTIEAATGLSWTQEIEDDRRAQPRTPHLLAIFSTPATTASQVYEIEIGKRKPDIEVFSEPCPNLARMIEAGAPESELAGIVDEHVNALIGRIGRAPDRAILGCTHYEIIAGLFRAALPPTTLLIHQPDATADAVQRYLERHPEYKPGSSGLRRFLTTGRPGEQNDLLKIFWGGPLQFEAA